MVNGEEEKVYPGLSSPRVKVIYGKKNINDVITSMILLELHKDIDYNNDNEDTKMMYKGDNSQWQGRVG